VSPLVELGFEEMATVVVAFFGGVAGLYGAIQSWLNQRKTRQLTLEMMMTKLDIDFDYDIIETADTKVLHGIITLRNLGNTNLRVPEFSFEGKDRTEEFIKAYRGNDFSSANNFEIGRFIGVSNSHLVSFGRESRSFFVSHTDQIYGRRMDGTRVRILDFDENISQYISEKTQTLKDAMTSTSANEKSFAELFFKEALSKEIRGLELFPGAAKTQEFMFEYTGQGVLYLDAETTSLRMLQSSVDAFEQLKNLGEELLSQNTMTPEHEARFCSLAKMSLMPESRELEKQKETFLIYLQ
jgi:hypothetical protein